MKKKRRRKSASGGRFAVTAIILLMLVTVLAWTLKHKERDENEEELWIPGRLNTEQMTADEGGQNSNDLLQEENLYSEQQSGECGETAGETVEGTVPEESNDGTEDEELMDLATPEAQAEAHRASFVADYTSAPLLNSTIIKYLTIQQGGQPGEIRFNWFSPSGAQGKVMLYNTATGESTSHEAATAASVTEAGFFYSKAVVTGLQENTEYIYKVGNKEGWSPEYTFTTKKFTGDFTFLVTSDAQIGQSQMEELQVTADRWDRVVTRLRDYMPEAAFLVHLGDQVAGYNDAEHYRGFFEHLALYQMPMVPIVGNHDIDSWDTGGGPWFYERYNVPNRSTIGCNWADTDGDYWFRYGNTLFMVLNSNTLYGPDVHAEFVDQACAANPDAKWKIILVHQSGYSSVERYQFESENCREHYAYLAETYDIDLFLSGHDHAYTRTALMNAFCEPLTQYDYASGGVLSNPEGAMYVNCSTASGCTYQPLFSNYAAVVQHQPEVPMAMQVDVTDTTLKLTSYLVDSWEVFDEITLEKP